LNGPDLQEDMVVEQKFDGLRRRCGIEDIGDLYVSRLSGVVGIVHGEDDMGILPHFMILVEH
jgi:hypothetical protein